MRTRSQSKPKPKSVAKSKTRIGKPRSKKDALNVRVKRFLLTRPEAGEEKGFFNPGFPMTNKKEWLDIKELVRKEFKISNQKVTAALHAFKNGKNLSSYKIDTVLSASETSSLLAEVLKYKKDAETHPFYEGAKAKTSCVYIEHDRANIETPASGLRKNRIYNKVVAHCKELVKGLPGVDPVNVDNHKIKQSFVHFYPENDKNKETPWHQDIDVNNASAIVLLSGDGKDEILTADTCPLSKPLDDSTPEVVGSFKVHTPKPGEALILGYRLHHAVPARNRTTERVVLVIWF